MKSSHDCAKLCRSGRTVVANDAMAHTALAIFELFSGHHAEARRRLHRALALNPNSEVARGYLGASYAFGGQLVDRRVAANTGVEADIPALRVREPNYT